MLNRAGAIDGKFRLAFVLDRAQLGISVPISSRSKWGEVLSLIGSIKVGHVAPSVMLRKLAAYERQNQLDVALREIGKVAELCAELGYP